MRQGFAGVMLKQGNNLHNRSQNHPKWRKRCKKSRSSLKIILIILLNCWGMVHYECIPGGQEVTQELSVTVFTVSARSTAKGMTGTLAETQLVSSLWQHCHAHGDVHPEVSHKRQNSSGSTAILQSWSLSRRLFQFLNVKVSLKGHQLESVEEIQEKLLELWIQIFSKLCMECLKQWKHLWNFIQSVQYKAEPPQSIQTCL